MVMSVCAKKPLPFAASILAGMLAVGVAVVLIMHKQASDEDTAIAEERLLVSAEQSTTGLKLAFIGARRGKRLL